MKKMNYYDKRNQRTESEKTSSIHGIDAFEIY